MPGGDADERKDASSGEQGGDACFTRFGLKRLAEERRHEDSRRNERREFEKREMGEPVDGFRVDERSCEDGGAASERQ